MDRIKLTSEDIEWLLAWRDEHKNEVRSYQSPLREVEIECEPSGFHIKAFRDGDRLKLYLTREGERVGRCKFVCRDDGLWVAKRNTLSKDQAQTCLTVYCSLMALMIHARLPAPAGDGTTKVSKRSHKPHRDATSASRPRTTYIIRREAGEILVAPSGSHASPRGTFTVRGHYRHYRSGKVVWIAEYKKGTGRNRAKTYKMGGEKDDEQ